MLIDTVVYYWNNILNGIVKQLQDGNIDEVLNPCEICSDQQHWAVLLKPSKAMFVLHKAIIFFLNVNKYLNQKHKFT